MHVCSTPSHTPRARLQLRSVPNPHTLSVIRCDCESESEPYSINYLEVLGLGGPGPGWASTQCVSAVSPGACFLIQLTLSYMGRTAGRGAVPSDTVFTLAAIPRLCVPPEC